MPRNPRRGPIQSPSANHQELASIPTAQTGSCPISPITTCSSKILHNSEKHPAGPPNLYSHNLATNTTRIRSGTGGRSKKPKSDRRGRKRTAEKIRDADTTEEVLPDGVDRQDAEFHRERFAIRLIDNRAVSLVYRIFKQRGTSNVARVPGLLSRCEFGIEILVLIATLVYLFRLSIARTCLLLRFFCGLQLSASQADSLLNRLAREWEPEFEVIAELLAHQAVVRADETSWSINSVWGFLSNTLCVMVFGCRKDAFTLEQLLSKSAFQGTLCSDNAAVYEGFSQAQKCWAHLLRKAIRLTMLVPDEDRYRTLLDGLLELYRDARKVKQDRRYGESGRKRKVGEFEDRLWWLITPRIDDETEPGTDYEREFLNLCLELMGLMMRQELFLFVTSDESVTGTNNEMEQELREPAMCRRTGQTSRTLRGARRRSVIVTVLESCRRSLREGGSEFTLDSLIETVTSWLIRGRSIFREQLQRLGLGGDTNSVLDTIYHHVQTANT